MIILCEFLLSAFCCPPLLANGQKSPQNINAALRQKTFRVELQAEGGMFFVPDSHDFAAAVGGVGPGRYFKIGRKRVGLNDQAVVARGFERIGHALEQIAIVVKNAIDLAVHQPFGPHNSSTRGLADRLMSQTNAQHRQLAGKSRDALAGNAGLSRRAGPGRNDEVRRGKPIDFIGRDFVVPEHPQIQRVIDLSQPLHEVVGERIVVIDKDDHVQYRISDVGFSVAASVNPNS
jgi:hypothetical protein